MSDKISANTCRDTATMAKMAEIGASIAGHNLMPKRANRSLLRWRRQWRGFNACTAPLAGLHNRLREIITNPQEARGLEQASSKRWSTVLIKRAQRDESAARGRHIVIPQRFHYALEASRDSAVYLLELCTRIGVSGRTLRLCCQEHLGMSPKLYLLMRRMHLVRQALRQASPSDINRDGLWVLGTRSLCCPLQIDIGRISI